MSEMKVVPPVEVSDAMLVSNVLESDAPTWSSTAAYAIGNRVMFDHRIYEALAAVPAGVKPGAETITGENPAKWTDNGPTNRWRMFNKRKGNTWTPGTFTSNPESIDLTITPGKRINALGLVGVRGASVRVVMTVGGSAVYDKTFAMSLKAGGSWYRYYFGEFMTKDNLAILDLPPFANASIRVLLSAPGGTAQVGMLVVGVAKTIGVAVYGTGLGSESYSFVREDDFGNVTITPRGRRRYVDFNIVMGGNQLSSAMRTLEPLSDVAALYIGAEEIDTTVIVGRFDRLALVLTTYDRAEYSLEVRSLM